MGWGPPLQSLHQSRRLFVLRSERRRAGLSFSLFSPHLIDRLPSMFSSPPPPRPSCAFPFPEKWFHSACLGRRGHLRRGWMGVEKPFPLGERKMRLNLSPSIGVAANKREGGKKEKGVRGVSLIRTRREEQVFFVKTNCLQKYAVDAGCNYVPANVDWKLVGFFHVRHSVTKWWSRTP